MDLRWRVRPVVVLAALLVTGLVLGQDTKKKSKKEEQEEPAKTKLKAPPKVEDDDTQTSRPAADEAAQELARLVGTPFDRVHLADGTTVRVKPFAHQIANAPPRVTVSPIAGEKDQNEFVVQPRDVKVDPFEAIALKAVEEYLQKTLAGLDTTPEKARQRFDRLQDAARALEKAITFHDSARERKVRDASPFWRDLERRLRLKLRSVQMDQLQALADAQDWDAASDLGRRLARAYVSHQDGKDVLASIAKLLSLHVQRAIQGKDFKQAFERFTVLENDFPNNPDVEALRQELTSQGEKFMDDVRRVEKQQDQDAALSKLVSTDLSWLPGSQDYKLRLENKYKILYVGVPDLPKFLSPATAVTDTEKLALDLLYESLLRLTYSRSGAPRYEPALAEELPDLQPLGRTFEINKKAYWSNGKRVMAADVGHTLRLLRDEKWPGRTPEFTQLLHSARTEGDLFQLSLTMSQGYLDPLALMNFKVLPQSLTRADDPGFATKPLGSGPFVYQKDEKESGRTVKFQANKYYGTRGGDFLNRPRIREVRFALPPDNPVADFRAGHIHLLLNVPSADCQKLASNNVKVLTLPSRRVYFLAVNHRRATLKNLHIRRAIGHAINREQILNDCFRAGKPEWHRPLNGPYPAGAWACKPTTPQFPADPHRALFAKSSADSAASQGLSKVNLTLKYPEGDEAVRQACFAIAKQVQEQAPGIELVPMSLKPRDLHEDVVVKQDYDLAYFHHDYADHTYWLWPLFDPSGMSSGGPNYMGYSNDAELLSKFHDVISRREFREVRERTHAIHEYILDNMLLIPLWQLDSHVALHASLSVPEPLDPLAIFREVDKWTLGSP
jgi:peptide/nickel transport system substrate-binding protein